MSDAHATRQPSGTAKSRPLWRPLDSLRTSMVKQVFAKEHFTHKKGLQFAPLIHATEHTGDALVPSESDEQVQDGGVHVHPQPDEHPIASSAEAPDIEEIRSQAFAEGLAQGLAQAQQQAQQHQAVNEEEAIAAQTAAQTQALLQEIALKVDALTEDSAQLQEPLKRLALHLAEQLVLTELSLSPQAIEHLIERCMDTLDASDASAIVVELNAQDLALLQNQQRVEGQPKPVWRLQTDHALLPGSVRVRADDAVVSDLIENRLESLAHNLLNNPKAWQTNSAFAPSKLASRLAAQRGSAQTVEDAQAKPQTQQPASATEPSMQASTHLEHARVDEAPEAHDIYENTDAQPVLEDEDKHTYEAHEVMKATSAPTEAMTAQFHETLNDITLELDKHDD